MGNQGAWGMGVWMQRLSPADQSLAETQPGSIMTKSPWAEGCASCCHQRGAGTEACPPPLPPPHLFPASRPWCDAAKPSILCFPPCFPSPSLGSPSPPPHPHCHRPGPGCSPAGPRGGFSESVTASAESLAARANGRSFFNQLKLHFLQISLPLSAAKKKPAGRQQKKPNTPPPWRLQSHRTSSRGDYL